MQNSAVILKEKAVLGRTNFLVTRLGFGAWGIGGKASGNVEEKEATSCLESYLYAGGNFIDTAISYGASETIIGKVLSKNDLHDKVYIATKTKSGQTKDTLHLIRNDIEESLRKLNRDYIDLYYMHMPPEDDDTMKYVLQEYERLKHEGKIRAIGASIKGPDVTENTVFLSRKYVDTNRVDVLELVYSIFRQKNSQVFDYARENNVGIVARTSIESGFLTGKYKAGHIFSEADHRSRWEPKKLEKVLENVDRLKEYAIIPPYSSIGEVAVRFVYDNPMVSSVIVGAKTVEQQLANMRIESLPPLRCELMERLKVEYADFTENCNTI